MKPYTAAKQWRDGFGANETRIAAADLVHIEDGISAATQGVTNLETKVGALPADILKQVQSIAADIRAALDKAIPVGTVAMYGAEKDPEGWMRCNGRLLERDNYPALFAAIGFTYGSDAQNKFRIPDMRGRSPIGASEGSQYLAGNKGGREGVNLTVGQLPPHTHEIGEAGDSSARFQAKKADKDIGVGTGGYTYLTSTGNNSNERSPVAVAAGSGDVVDIRHPFFAIPYIIKVL